MRCPRCKRLDDILAYRPMMQIEEYEDQTVPIYACPKCNWRFAPAPSLTESYEVACFFREAKSL